MPKVIISIEYGGDNHDFVNLGGELKGVGKCLRIEEHTHGSDAPGTLYYIAHFDSGYSTKIFYVNQIWEQERSAEQ